jgi:hypothetical protein
VSNLEKLKKERAEAIRLDTLTSREEKKERKQNTQHLPDIGKTNKGKHLQGKSPTTAAGEPRKTPTQSRQNINDLEE